MTTPSQEDPGPRRGWEDSPIKLLVVLILVIVSTECLITFAVGRLLPGQPMVTEIVLESVLLVGILFPTLYLLIFTPLVHSTSKRRSAELALLSSETRCHFLADNLHDIIWELDAELRVVFVSHSAEEMLGYAAEDMVGKVVLELLTPKSRLKVSGMLEDVVAWHAETEALNVTRSAEFACIRKDGTNLWTEVNATFVFGHGAGLRKVVGVTRDIAKRKEAEERLKVSLQHKEILIKEIDHRVKNNLQLISGLLRLQEKYYTDHHHVGLLHDSQHRVSALATLYEMLSDSADLTSINFTDFTKRLLAYLYPACGVDSTTVIPAVASGDIRLDIDTAIPCALILNELISNALKYAFPDGRRGRLTISLEQRSDDGMVLLVKDDGVGFAPAIDFHQAPSLGLRLVRLLAEQLDGTSDHSDDNGTAITINFRRASALENNRIYDNSAHTGS